jgi:histidine triad (HIT) family protein
MDNCLFCQIVAGTTPSHKIYEDEDYIGLLDIYPSTRGQSLVIPKKHYSSYVFDMPSTEYADFMKCVRKIAKHLDKSLGAIRTCMVMEGLEIDHAHIKLYPVHVILANTNKMIVDLNEYPGYLTTLHGERMSDYDLNILAQEIRIN